nr:MAG TPA: Transcription elongation factor Elf1 like [Bacteriophage sp.]
MIKLNTKKENKIQCPYCGHPLNVFYDKSAECKGVFFKCKNKECKKVFELRI